MTSSTSVIISGSSAEVGSSNSMMRGCMASARAMATRCCWPPESWLGKASAFSGMPTRLSSARAARSASAARLAPHDDRRQGDVLERGHVRIEVQ